jgi:hypothetical protein
MHSYQQLVETRTAADTKDSAVVLESLLITLDYQQWVICSVLETTTDDSFKPLQMTFFVVVY